MDVITLTFINTIDFLVGNTLYYIEQNTKISKPIPLQLDEGINMIKWFFILGMKKLAESMESAFLYGGVDIYSGNVYVKMLM